LKERRERQLDQPVWWGVPTKNTLDRVTSMLPKLLYQRLDEIGLDFAALSDRGAAHPVHRRRGDARGNLLCGKYKQRRVKYS
jgi:hypothetical protein